MWHDRKNTGLGILRPEFRVCLPPSLTMISALPFSLCKNDDNPCPTYFKSCWKVKVRSTHTWLIVKFDTNIRHYHNRVYKEHSWTGILNMFTQKDLTVPGTVTKGYYTNVNILSRMQCILPRQRSHKIQFTHFLLKECKFYLYLFIVSKMSRHHLWMRARL